MIPHARVLVVDDDDDLCELLVDKLSREGYRADAVADSASCRALLRRSTYHAVLTDVQLGSGDSGILLCDQITREFPDLPVIVITGCDPADSSLVARRAGAYDFVAKPLSAGPLLLAVARAVAHKRLCDQVRRLQQETRLIDTIELVGEGPLMRAVLDDIRRLGGSAVNVLLSGEPGTGKSSIARAVHARSNRADGPFVTLDCAGAPPPAVEQALFGSDLPTARRLGALARADEGTLLLQNVDALPPDAQTALASSVHSRHVPSTSAADAVPFDARLIATTSRDLGRSVDRAVFREELLRRIAITVVNVPPLRARGHDILLIAQRELVRLSAAGGRDVRGISAPVAHILLDYPWPGNVSELLRCVARAATRARGRVLEPRDLSERLRGHTRFWLLNEPDDPAHLPTLDELQRRYISRVLASVDGNKSRASRVLGVDRRTLYRKLDQLELTSAPR